jgi:hypothetical protein
MPLATFRHTAEAAAAPSDIWPTLQDAATWAAVGPISEVWDAEHDDEGALRSFRFRTEAGGRSWEGTARTVVAEAPEKMDLVLSTDEIRGRVGVELGLDGKRTLVSVRLEVEPAGMLATLFWSVVRQAISTGFKDGVEDLAAGLGS